MRLKPALESTSLHFVTGKNLSHASNSKTGQKEKVPPTASGGPQPQLLSYIIHLTRHCNRANLKALRETSPTAKRRRPGLWPEPCRFKVNVVTIEFVLL